MALKSKKSKNRRVSNRKKTGSQPDHTGRAADSRSGSSGRTNAYPSRNGLRSSAGVRRSASPAEHRAKSTAREKASDSAVSAPVQAEQEIVFWTRSSNGAQEQKAAEQRSGEKVKKASDETIQVRPVMTVEQIWGGTGSDSAVTYSRSTASEKKTVPESAEGRSAGNDTAGSRAGVGRAAGLEAAGPAANRKITPPNTSAVYSADDEKKTAAESGKTAPSDTLAVDSADAVKSAAADFNDKKATTDTIVVETGRRGKKTAAGAGPASAAEEHKGTAASERTAAGSAAAQAALASHDAEAAGPSAEDRNPAAEKAEAEPEARGFAARRKQAKARKKAAKAEKKAAKAERKAAKAAKAAGTGAAESAAAAAGTAAAGQAAVVGTVTAASSAGTAGAAVSSAAASTAGSRTEAGKTAAGNRAVGTAAGSRAGAGASGAANTTAADREAAGQNSLRGAAKATVTAAAAGTAAAGTAAAGRSTGSRASEPSRSADAVEHAPGVFHESEDKGLDEWFQGLEDFGINALFEELERKKRQEAAEEEDDLFSEDLEDLSAGGSRMGSRRSGLQPEASSSAGEKTGSSSVSGTVSAVAAGTAAAAGGLAAASEARHGSSGAGSAAGTGTGGSEIGTMGNQHADSGPPAGSSSAGSENRTAGNKNADSSAAAGKTSAAAVDTGAETAAGRSAEKASETGKAAAAAAAAGGSLAAGAAAQDRKAKASASSGSSLDKAKAEDTGSESPASAEKGTDGARSEDRGSEGVPPAGESSEQETTENSSKKSGKKSLWGRRGSEEQKELKEFEDEAARKRAERREKRKRARLVSMGTYLVCLQAACGFFLSFRLFRLNVLPVKYLLAFIGILALLVLIPALVIRVRHETATRRRLMIGIVLSLVLIVVSIVGTYAVAKASDTLFSVSLTKEDAIEYTTAVIGVYVMAEDQAETLKDADSYIFARQADVDEVNMRKAIISLRNDLGKNISIQKKESAGEMIEALYNGDVQAVILNTGYMDLLGESSAYYDFNEKTKLLAKIEVRSEVSEQTRFSEESKVTTEPFVVYLSGSDTREETLTVGRSDVNILMIVNPETKEVLLVNTPRDFYVSNPAARGAKDKLTHCASYGLDNVLKTLENLYSVEIDYYAQINFTGFEKLVDALGGITVYSDVSFDSDFYTVEGYHFKEGKNQLDGTAALSFARDRHNQIDGDYGRGRHQMAVIEGILEKATSSKIILGNYSEIMDSLKGMFVTDLSSDSMAAIIKMQLDDMADWNVQSYPVIGSGGMAVTYSMPGTELSVAYPIRSSVNRARLLIDKVEDGDTIKDSDIDPSLKEDGEKTKMEGSIFSDFVSTEGWISQTARTYSWLNVEGEEGGEAEEEEEA